MLAEPSEQPVPFVACTHNKSILHNQSSISRTKGATTATTAGQDRNHVESTRQHLPKRPVSPKHLKAGRRVSAGLQRLRHTQLPMWLCIDVHHDCSPSRTNMCFSGPSPGSADLIFLFRFLVRYCLDRCIHSMAEFSRVIT